MSPQALNDNLSILQVALEQVQDGVYLTNKQGRILYVNNAAQQLSGYDKQSLLQKTIADIDLEMTAETWVLFFQQLRNVKNMTLKAHQQHPDGSLLPIEFKISHLSLDGEEYSVGVARDITQHQLHSEFYELQQQLSEMVFGEDADKLLRYGLDQAERLTQSKIGFFHFVENKSENVALQVWSSNTLEKMCFAEGEGLHYPIAEAGIWVESIHSRQPYICNDYAAHPGKQGCPKGHAELHRFATVPLLQQGEVVAIMGVGEKANDYDREDVSILRTIIEMIFVYYQRLQAEQKIGFMAYHDVLTGLANRHLLMERLERAIALAKRNRRSIGVCYLDIQGFKQINDLYDHSFGDKVLQTLAARLQHELREVDTIARLGGDEFVFVLCGIKSVAECEQALKRIQQVLMLPFDIRKERIYLAAKIGSTLYPLDDSDADTLLLHAKQSVETVKQMPQRFFHIYDPTVEQQLQLNQGMAKRFASALKDNELQLYLQPKIELKSLQVIGFEGLIRWQHPQLGLLTPDKFLPALTDTAQEFALGEWVLRRAVELLQAWQDAGLDLTMSINISPRQIQQPAFSELVLSVLQQAPAGLSQRLEIELLEDADVEDGHTVAENMQVLKAQGVKFELDDFGTGYASLAHFYDLPFDVLKIDQNFVKQMLDRVDNLDIVEGVLKLSEAIERPVIAEGVESIEIGYMLMKMGCQFAQGYGIAKPMPEDQVIGWLEQWQVNNPWQDLCSEIHNDSLRYDLGVAVFSHRWWVHAIERHIEFGLSMADKKDAPSPMPELDESRCQFYNWYRGIGRSRYGHQPGYAFMQATHNELHELSRSIQACSQAGDYQQAWQLFAKLKHLSNELIHQLQDFSNH